MRQQGCDEPRVVQRFLGLSDSSKLVRLSHEVQLKRQVKNPENSTNTLRGFIKENPRANFLEFVTGGIVVEFLHDSKTKKLAAPQLLCSLFRVHPCIPLHKCVQINLLLIVISEVEKHQREQ